MAAIITNFNTGEIVKSTQRNYDGQGVFIAGYEATTDRRGEFKFLPRAVSLSTPFKNFDNHVVNSTLMLKSGIDITFENDILDRITELHFKELVETGRLIKIGTAIMTGAHSFRLESLTPIIKGAGDIEGINNFLKIIEAEKAVEWTGNLKKYAGVKAMMARQRAVEQNKRLGRI